MSTISDEESFVILGTSPTPSMESFNQNKNDNTKSIKSNYDEKNSTLQENKKDLLSSVSSTNSDGNFSLLTHSTIKNNHSIVISENRDKNDKNQINNDEQEKENKTSLNSSSYKFGFESISKDKNTIIIPTTDVFSTAKSETSLNASKKDVCESVKSNSLLQFSSLKNSSVQLQLSNNNEKSSQYSSKLSDSSDNSLAASFLLGQVSKDEIKVSSFHVPFIPRILFRKIRFFLK